MPGYGGTGRAKILLQLHQMHLFNQEQVAAGTASVAAQLERTRYAYPSGISIQVYFTDVNGNPASPGTFEIDVQGSDIDQDAQYCTETTYTGPLNGSDIGRIELGSFNAKYVRVYLKTLGSAVYTTAILTSFAGAGGGSSSSGGGGGAGVSSLNSLTGALSITAGTGITVTPSGSTIQIASTGGGGAPSGPAGGDLTGTYPNPQVAGSSVNGTATTAGFALTGAIGAGTNPTPYMYFNQGATQPTTWSASGTVLGMNAPSGFSGNLLDFHVNGGIQVFGVASTGSCFAAQFLVQTAAGLLAFINNSGSLLMRSSSTNAGIVGWSSTTSAGGTIDSVLSRQAAGVIQIGTSNTSLNNAGSLSLAQILLNGGTAAASLSQFLCTTAPYTAGTGTTNFPVVYLNSGATAPGTFSTAGTVLGFNTPLGFTGNFIDCHQNGGGSLFFLTYVGNATATQFTVGASNLATLGSTGFLALRSSTGSYTGMITWSSTAVATSGTDTSLSRQGPGVVQVGAASTSPNSQGSLMLGQIMGGSGAPAIAAMTGAGTGPTVSVTGNNTAGSISVTTGTAPTASAQIIQVTFANAFAYAANPFVCLTPGNAAAAALTGAQAIWVSTATTIFALIAGSTALAATTTYVWMYMVQG